MGLHEPLTDKSTAPGAFGRIAEAYCDPSLNIARDNGHQGINQLGRASREFLWNQGHAEALSPFDRDTVGLDLLEGETRQDLRTAALEAQARCLEETGKPHARTIAGLLRKMGPSIEAVAYGYGEAARHNYTAATPNRVMTEGLMMALVSKPGPDRAAHHRLFQDRPAYENWDRVDSRIADRMREASSFYAGLDQKDLITATRAVQQATCEELTHFTSPGSEENLKLKAMIGVIRKAPGREVAKIQASIDESAGINPEGTSKLPSEHPLLVLTRATSTVLDERMASRKKAVSHDTR